MTTSGVSGSSGTSDTQNTNDQSKSSSTSTEAMANQDVFMKLLVAELKNQNPLSPADGTEFMSQLTQFSELEQMVGSRKELEAIHTILNPSTATSTGTSTQGTSSETTGTAADPDTDTTNSKAQSSAAA